ncbi:MAG: hypothetical protein AB7F50_06535 [Fimbriimonadaceae bacterium]
MDLLLKAELAFEKEPLGQAASWRRWFAFGRPLLTFGWLSLVLLVPRYSDRNPWIQWPVSLRVVQRLFSGDAFTTVKA